ncbi:hypothetical protein K2173_028232 [Erythroxylum novogranatense]|uniref:Thiolase N-terminal domain-containing protein n=1 Tax=Erythroxylum novogranatense TaxID=1862640 RepID=A0AAV8U501_9ROSI|nr:hypothetical protein K2173_028232 [Erythroxylum novogranatense]
MLKDGLWDVYNDFGMGICGEICADQYSITRQEQDSYAIRSFECGIATQNASLFSWEIVPVEVSGGRGKPSTLVDRDEGLEKFDAAKLRRLKPSFKVNSGSVTAGNSSSIRNMQELVTCAGEDAQVNVTTDSYATVNTKLDYGSSSLLFRKCSRIW